MYTAAIKVTEDLGIKLGKDANAQQNKHAASIENTIRTTSPR